jgi:Family of unknown function (DUF5317)
MLLVLAVAACFVGVRLAGGRLMQLADLSIRAVGAALVAILIQVAIVDVIPGGAHGLHVALHISSYLLAGYFLVRNREVPGLWLIALGGAMNFAAIAANGGVMPASVSALRKAGIEPSGGFANSASVAHPKVLFLGDILAVPGPWPIGNVFSFGDLILLVGLVVLLRRACGPLGRPELVVSPDR